MKEQNRTRNRDRNILIIKITAGNNQPVVIFLQIKFQNVRLSPENRQITYNPHVNSQF